jgi:membrane protein
MRRVAPEGESKAGAHGLFKRTAAGLSGRWQHLQSRNRWIASAAEAGRGFSRHGLSLPSVFFAFNTFLAIFPLLLFVSSMLGFVLAGHATLQQSILNELLNIFPGAANALKSLLDSIVTNRALVGVIGFVTLLWAGTRVPWALEVGFNLVWPAHRRPFVKRKLLALWVLVVIGLLGALTIGVSLFSSALLSWTLSHAGGLLAVLVFMLGVGFSLATNFLIFFMVYSIIPQRRLEPGAVARGAAVASVLFIISEYVFNFYFVSISRWQVLYGTIGALLGVMIWLQVLGIIFFYCAEIVALHSSRQSEARPAT